MKKTYIITDPCYFVPQDDWATLCASADAQAQASDEWQNAFLKKLGAYFAKHQIKGYVSETGFGDWTNVVRSADPKVNVLHGEFAADSGLVAVVEFTPKIISALQQEAGVWAYAVLEIKNLGGEVSVTFDRTNPEWTVVILHDQEGNLLAKTGEPSEDF